METDMVEVAKFSSVTQIPIPAGATVEERRSVALEQANRHRMAMLNCLYYYNTLTDISRLPGEILVMIFKSFRALFTCTRFGRNTHGYIRIAHICRHWRDLALQTPSLWSYVVTNNTKDCLSTMLSYSEGSPLTVLTAFSDDHTANLWRAQLLASQNHRIQHLDLTVRNGTGNWRPPYCETPDIRGGDLAALDVPTLKRLELYGPSCAEVDKFPFDRSPSSLLRHLKLWTSWDGTCYWSDELDSGRILSVLDTLPQLVSLDVRGMCFPQNAVLAMSKRQITLDKLEALTLHSYQESCNCWLLSHLDFPPKTKLRLGAGYNRHQLEYQGGTLAWIERLAGLPRIARSKLSLDTNPLRCLFVEGSYQGTCMVGWKECHPSVLASFQQWKDSQGSSPYRPGNRDNLHGAEEDSLDVPPDMVLTWIDASGMTALDYNGFNGASVYFPLSHLETLRLEYRTMRTGPPLSHTILSIRQLRNLRTLSLPGWPQPCVDILLGWPEREIKFDHIEELFTDLRAYQPSVDETAEEGKGVDADDRPYTQQASSGDSTDTHDGGGAESPRTPDPSLPFPLLTSLHIFYDGTVYPLASSDTERQQQPSFDALRRALADRQQVFSGSNLPELIILNLPGVTEAELEELCRYVDVVKWGETWNTLNTSVDVVFGGGNGVDSGAGSGDSETEEEGQAQVRLGEGTRVIAGDEEESTTPVGTDNPDASHEACLQNESGGLDTGNISAPPGE